MFESSYNDSFLAATALDAVDDAVVADNCRPHWAQTAEKRMTDDSIGALQYWPAGRHYAGRRPTGSSQIDCRLRVLESRM